MSLEEQVKQALNNFDSTSSGDLLEMLDQIKHNFKSELTSEYLQGKIEKIRDAGNEAEKKTQCKALTPYLDWYLQGL